MDRICVTSLGLTFVLKASLNVCFLVRTIECKSCMFCFNLCFRVNNTDLMLFDLYPSSDIGCKLYCIITCKLHLKMNLGNPLFIDSKIDNFLFDKIVRGKLIITIVNEHIKPVITPLYSS